MGLKHIVMYSGGVGSFITAKMVVDKYGVDNTILLFADVLMEDWDLYRFNRDVEKVLGLQITSISEGRDPWQVQIDAKFGTNSRIDPCSKILKREFMDHWVQQFHPGDVVCYVGIDASESHRIKGLQPRKLPYLYFAPMVDAGMMLTKDQKIEYCRNFGIEPPRLYLLGFPHNNCGGACPKAGLAQWKLLYETMPERYLWNEKQQENLFRLVPNARPFLRKIENGKIRYMSLREFREEYLTGIKELSKMDQFAWGGCGCALDDGSNDPVKQKQSI